LSATARPATFGSPSVVVTIALGIALALSCVIGALAVAPWQASRRAGQTAVDGRRTQLLKVGIAIYLATGLSLAIVIFMS
jgi:hypothetical protein